jgi:hypothetical protein
MPSPANGPATLLNKTVHTGRNYRQEACGAEVDINAHQDRRCDEVA